MESISQIDLDKKASPAILAGLLGISVARVYQFRQIGELPADTEATYRENISHYLTFLRNRLKARSVPAMEEKTIQETRVLKIKEELMTRELATEKQEYVSTTELYELFLPMFQIMQTSFASIAKRYPETTKEVDDTLRTLYSLGETFCEIADKKREDFILYCQTREVISEETKERMLGELTETEEFINAIEVTE